MRSYSKNYSILRLLIVTMLSDISEAKMLEWPWSKWKASNWLGAQYAMLPSILPFLANTTPLASREHSS